MNSGLFSAFSAFASLQSLQHMCINPQCFLGYAVFNPSSDLAGPITANTLLCLHIHLY